MQPNANNGPSDSKCDFAVNLFCFLIGFYGLISVYILHLQKYDPDDYVLSHILAWLLCSVLVIKFLKLSFEWVHHNCCVKAGNEGDESYRQRRTSSWKFVGYALYFIATGVSCSLSLKYYYGSPPIAVRKEGVDPALASRFLAVIYFLGILYACGFVKMILDYLIQYEPDLPDFTIDARQRLWMNLSNWFLFSIVMGILVIASHNNLKVLNGLPEDHYYGYRTLFSFSVIIFGVLFFTGLILMAVNLAYRFFIHDTDSQNEPHAEGTKPVSLLEQQVKATIHGMNLSVTGTSSASISQGATVETEITDRSTSRPTSIPDSSDPEVVRTI